MSTQTFQTEAKKLLADLAEKHGLSINLAAQNENTFSVRLCPKTADGIPDSFKRLASAFGLLPEDYGKTFRDKTHSYTITGINQNSCKYPIEVVRDDGRDFRYPSRNVVNLLRPGTATKLTATLSPLVTPPVQPTATGSVTIPVDFSTQAWYVGLEKDTYGKSFRAKGSLYTVSAIKTQYPKYPVICTRQDGKKFKFSVAQVRFQLGLPTLPGPAIR